MVKDGKDGQKKMDADLRRRQARAKQASGDGPGKAPEQPATAVQAPDIRRPRLALVPQDRDGKEAGSVKAEQSQTDSTPTPEPEDGFSWEEVEVIGLDQADEQKIGDRFYVNPKHVFGDPRQPRKFFDKEALAGLAESIKHEGQEDYAKVYRFSDPEVPECAWILKDGERRKRACEMKELPLWVELISQPRSRTLLLIGQLISNEQREGHTHQEIADSIAELIAAGKTTADIARIFGKSPAWVATYRRFGQLGPVITAMTSPEVPDSERLRLPVAVLLSKFPEEARLDVARKVRGMPLQKASRIINLELGDEAPDSGVRKRKPSDRRGTLENALNRAISQLSPQLRSLKEMSDEQLARMFTHVEPLVRQEVLANLDRVNKLATEIRERIEACLPD